MKLSKRTNMIILWIISIALVLGMIVMFTPTIGNPFATGPRDAGRTALLVNGVAVTERHVELQRQQSGLVGAGLPGQVGEDLDLLVLDSIIDQEVLRQAAARTRVSGADVREAVNEFREAQGVAGRANEQAYLNLLRQHGFTDESFRRHIETQLRQERYLDGVIGSVEVSDEEVRAYYEAHRDNYRTDPRIRARQIVVDDEALAEELHTRVLAGEDFAELAGEYSVERADSGGALGAPEGSTEPQPVSRAALPTAVAGAAFDLQAAGLTEVVSSGGRYYLVSVEEYLPAGVRPFEEVAERAREDALQAKREGEVERVLEELRADAVVEAPDDSQYAFDDEVVAVVGEREIPRSELARATYLNPQVQQFLGPETATLITDFFTPTILEQLIDRELAYQGASELEVPLVGSRDQVALAALNYVSRDAEASEEAVQAYYETNVSRFTVPARATVTRADFETAEAAMEFREALIAADSVDDEVVSAAAENAGGTLEQLGAVSPGQLGPELDNPLFTSDAFTPLASEAGEEISDVLVIREEVTPEGEEDAAEQAEHDALPSDEVVEGEEEAETEAEQAEIETTETHVVLVAIRTDEFVRPLEEVRPQVEAAVVASQRQELRDNWLAELREVVTVENRLEVADETPALDFEALPDDATEELEIIEEAPEVPAATEDEAPAALDEPEVEAEE